MVVCLFNAIKLHKCTVILIMNTIRSVYIRTKHVFSADLYIDDNKSMYKTIGFSRFSMMGALGAAIDKETRNINSQAGKVGITGNLKGDKLQLGGLLIVEKGVLWYETFVEVILFLRNLWFRDFFKL